LATNFFLVWAVSVAAKDFALARFRAALREQLDVIDANWSGALDQSDPEALHDLRVAIRRTRSLITDAKQVLPNAKRRRFAEGFRELAGATTMARDFDVAVADWPTMIGLVDDAHVPALGAVHDELRRRQHTARDNLATALQSADALTLLREWRAFLDKAPTFRGKFSRARIGRVVKRRTRRNLKRLRKLARDTSPEGRHEWRKRAKRLRYLIEAFPDAFAKKRRKQLRRSLVAAQDEVGRERDRLVQAGIIDAIAANPSLPTDSHDAAAALAAALRVATRRADRRNH
jgi:CHAD domain-containing protein